jgi:phage replication-related protein YjqB (UPF0714/DUF867 family)
MTMADRYRNFADLAAAETEGLDYRICLTRRTSPIVVIAPHGGEIEPGSSHIAAAIAADAFALYCFEGMTPGRPHGDLHIASERFDEPQWRRLVRRRDIAIGVHGRADNGDPDAAWLGGLDFALRDAIAAALEAQGFAALTSGHDLPGTQPNNVCNRGRSGAGAQLELPRTLRRDLIADAARRGTFADAVRQAVEAHVG